MDNKEYIDHLTPSEIVETFPEGLEIVKRQLKFYRKGRKNAEPLFKSVLEDIFEEIYSLPENDARMKFVRTKDRWCDMNAREWYMKPMERIERRIKKLEQLEKLYEMRGKEVPEGMITEQDILAAKTISLFNYLDPPINGKVPCLWHDDRHPSAHWYGDKNTIYCFVCNKSFDVIDVVMKLYGNSFIEAVKMILNK